MESTVNEQLLAKIRYSLANLPITINTTFGDPFQPNQWENTLNKFKYLKQQNYQGEVEVSTKWILSDEQIDVLYSVDPDIWIICGVTGLNEGKGVSLQDRFDNYLRICKRFKKTVLNIRPLIPGKNDSMTVLTPIIEVVAKGRGYLKHGGYLDPLDANSKKTNYDSLKNEIRSLCTKLRINDAPRCSCIVTDVTGKINSTFEESDPKNLDVLEALGFNFETDNGYVKLTGFRNSGKVTKGDVSFARLIIESSHILDNWTDSHQYMQMKGPNGQTLVCTSSWFHWAREVECVINCYYCHVRPGTEIYFESGDSGCSPIDLYDALRSENRLEGKIRYDY
ncbi:MAG: hypothetical protein LBL79_14035 [Prevotella sp.]|jgi:DNA repair photolyase|nr:hypothetical protein [Prevotella sp.]